MCPAGSGHRAQARARAQARLRAQARKRSSSSMQLLSLYLIWKEEHTKKKPSKSQFTFFENLQNFKKSELVAVKHLPFSQKFFFL